MTPLCKTEHVALGSALRIEREGKPPLAIFHLKSGFFVTDDLCTHGVASLAEGEIDLDDGVVECPWHQGAFEIETGRPCAAPCTKPIKVHSVVVADGKIFLAE